LAILIGAFASALVMGWVLLAMNNAGTIHVRASDVAPGLVAPAPALVDASRAHLVGPMAGVDTQEYRVWHQTDTNGVARKWLVDDSGKAVWLVDPAITGTEAKLPSGATVTKYDAPKTVLVSYIIKGVLDRKLPWDLVLIGVMIALVLELSGIPSLAFAVGVYLPISTSLGIFVGGCVRWCVDRAAHTRGRLQGLTASEIAAESDRSPGVLMASGYIAGGSIAGIGVAISQGVTTGFNESVEKWMTAHNPFFEGPSSDALSLLPFAGLVVLLYLAGKSGESQQKAAAGKIS
jgi:hypothetical protein